MKLGYYRAASTISEEKLQYYKEYLKHFGAEKIYIETNQHGRTSNRPVLLKLLKEAKRGDTIITPTTDRLGRRLITVNSILKKAEKKGIYILFPKEENLKNSIILRNYIDNLYKFEKKAQKITNKIEAEIEKHTDKHNQ